MTSCLIALTLFLGTHSVNPNLKYGWMVRDRDTGLPVFTWFSDGTKSYVFSLESTEKANKHLYDPLPCSHEGSTYFYGEWSMSPRETKEENEHAPI